MPSQSGKATVHFAGLLANVDSSILSVKFNHGFGINKFSRRRGIDFFAALESWVSKREIEWDLYKVCGMNFDENEFYVIQKSIDLEKKPTLRAMEKMPDYRKLSKLVSKYLIPTVEMMRLFKSGNICLPKRYLYVTFGSRIAYISYHTTDEVEPEPYVVHESELAALSEFMNNRKEFKQPYVQLAYENLDMSYETIYIRLRFLAVMMGLEALFNPGQQEVRYRVSRNVAALLGRDCAEFRTILRDIKGLYDKRSELLHNGEANIVDNDVYLARDYLKRSIRALRLDERKKDRLLGWLNTLGFKEATPLNGR